MTSQQPVDLVTGFFASLAQGRVDDAFSLIDDDIVYTNVGLPTIRGRRRFEALMRRINSEHIAFDAEFLAIGANDDGVVLTERIDELRVGPLRLRFWVCGRNEVRDGRIAVWRDYFDAWDCTRAFARALVGVVVPSLNRKPLGAPVSVLSV